MGLVDDDKSSAGRLVCLLFTIILRVSGACREFYDFRNGPGRGAGPSADRGKHVVDTEARSGSRRVCELCAASTLPHTKSPTTGAARHTQATSAGLVARRGTRAPPRATPPHRAAP
ncbi:hypothetical protein EVAR_9085_1 [Eumeta japonica]|uniref:Uncharacterized protein n=1 Tax=Eumeta variegata TaxID=151549 RepID=A0A4C1TW18_EUMVA|nr:hypothetical protein EVAR_9085_1 [Eumeta japonica]